jgi:hypothetical protein
VEDQAGTEEECDSQSRNEDIGTLTCSSIVTSVEKACDTEVQPHSTDSDTDVQPHSTDSDDNIPDSLNFMADTKATSH